MKRLTNFAWSDDDGALHLDIPAMLREMEVEDTPENRDLLVQYAGEFFAKEGAKKIIVEERPG